MRPRLLRLFRTDPSLMLPKPRNVIIIPAMLLPKGPWKTVRRVYSNRICVVIPQSSKHRTGEIGFEHSVDARFSVLSISTGQFQVRIMGYEISRVNGPTEGFFASLSPR